MGKKVGVGGVIMAIEQSLKLELSYDITYMNRPGCSVTFSQQVIK